MATEVEFGSKAVANQHRDEHPDHIAGEYDRRFKKVVFDSDTPEKVLEQAQRKADETRGEDTSGTQQIPLTDKEKAKLDFTRDNIDALKIRRIKGLAQDMGVSDWFNEMDPTVSVESNKDIFERPGAQSGGARSDVQTDPDAKASEAAKTAQSEECNHAEGHCRHGEPDACEFLTNQCGMDQETVDKIMGEEEAAPEDLPGPVLGALSDLWGGYKGGITQAKDAAAGINEIREQYGQEPLTFDELGGRTIYPEDAGADVTDGCQGDLDLDGIGRTGDMATDTHRDHADRLPDLEGRAENMALEGEPMDRPDRDETEYFLVHEDGAHKGIYGPFDRATAEKTKAKLGHFWEIQTDGPRQDRAERMALDGEPMGRPGQEPDTTPEDAGSIAQMYGPVGEWGFEGESAKKYSGETAPKWQWTRETGQFEPGPEKVTVFPTNRGWPDAYAASVANLDLLEKKRIGGGTAVDAVSQALEYMTANPGGIPQGTFEAGKGPGQRRAGRMADHAPDEPMGHPDRDDSRPWDVQHVQDLVFTDRDTAELVHETYRGWPDLATQLDGHIARNNELSSFGRNQHRLEGQDAARVSKHLTPEKARRIMIAADDDLGLTDVENHVFNEPMGTLSNTIKETPKRDRAGRMADHAELPERARLPEERARMHRQKARAIERNEQTDLSGNRKAQATFAGDYGTSDPEIESQTEEVNEGGLMADTRSDTGDTETEQASPDFMQVAEGGQGSLGTGPQIEDLQDAIDYLTDQTDGYGDRIEWDGKVRDHLDAAGLDAGAWTEKQSQDVFRYGIDAEDVTARWSETLGPSKDVGNYLPHLIELAREDSQQ